MLRLYYNLGNKYTLHLYDFYTITNMVGIQIHRGGQAGHLLEAEEGGGCRAHSPLCVNGAFIMEDTLTDDVKDITVIPVIIQKEDARGAMRTRAARMAAHFTGRAMRPHR